MDLELGALRSFLAVADQLHFGRAATSLRIAQPALSRQIRRLERDLDVELFTRTSRSVALTPAGAVLQSRARALLAQAGRDAAETVRVSRGEQGRLDVGFIGSALPLGALARVQGFRERFPLVEVHLVEDWTARLVPRVLRGELDLAVVRDPDPAPGLRATPYRSERYVAAVPSSHRFAGRGSLRGPELVDEPFVFFPPEASRLATERNLAPVVAEGGAPRVVQQGSSWTTVLHLVAAGMGVTVAPASALDAAPPGIVPLELSGTTATSTLVWLNREDDDRPIVAAFTAVP